MKGILEFCPMHMSFWTAAVTQTLINTTYTLSYLKSTIILWGRHCYPFLKTEKKKKKNRDYSWCYGTIHMVTSFSLASGLKPNSPNCWEGFLAETSSRKDTWTKRNALPKAMLPPQGQLTPVTGIYGLWRPHPRASMQDNTDVPFQPQHTPRIGWGLCYKCIAVQFLLLSNPAFLIPHPSSMCSRALSANLLHANFRIWVYFSRNLI